MEVPNLRNKDNWSWAFGLWLVQLIVLLVAGIAIELFLTVPRSAYAQSGTVITQTHSTVADWQGCVITNTNMSIANASGGELRLAATVEDYFDGNTIDATRWYSGLANTIENWQWTVSPTVASGILTLDANYLLSVATLTQFPRFFEARARMVQTPETSGNPDLGFWRHPTLGPRYVIDSSFYTVGGSRVFYYSQRTPDSLVSTGRDNTNTFEQDPTDPANMDQYHLYRIEWQTTPSSEVRFYVDGSLWDTSLMATTMITSWVFLYHQDPTVPYGTTPQTIDWVRAGRYPASGEFVSCAIDGNGASWNTLWFTPTTPTNTSAQMSVRSSPDGLTWGDWTTPTATSPLSITALGKVKFMQYRLQSGSSDVMQSPQVDAVTFTRITNPTAVTMSDFQARTEWWLDWRWTILAAGVIALGVFGLRARRP